MEVKCNECGHIYEEYDIYGDYHSLYSICPNCFNEIHFKRKQRVIECIECGSDFLENCYEWEYPIGVCPTCRE